MSLVAVTLSGGEPDDLRHSVRERHLAALRAAGLTPVAVAGTASPEEVEEVLAVCAAVYLPGTDYVPSRAGEGEENSRRGAAAAGLAWDPHKVAADFSVLDVAWRRRLPTLGICGGMQAMAVADGATLRAGSYAEQRYHADVWEQRPVLLEPGSTAATVLGERTGANSYHRQVLDSPPATLRVTGHAADGVPEAVEADPRAHPFWLGLQWHPELLPDPRPYAALSRAAARATRS